MPLKVTDRMAQDLLWTYASRRRAVDAEFSEDLETALLEAGFSVRTPAPPGGQMDRPTLSLVKCEITYYCVVDGDGHLQVHKPSNQMAQLSMGTHWFPTEGVPDDAFVVLNREIEAAF